MTIAAKQTYIQQLDEIESSSAFATLITGLQKTYSVTSPFYAMLQSKVSTPYEGGGLMKFQFDTDYMDAQFFAGNSTLTVQQIEALKNGSIQMAMLNATISYNLDQLRYNSGKGQLWDYVKRQLAKGDEAIKRKAAWSTFADGTNDLDGNALTPVAGIPVIQGLGLILPNSNTSGSYAGITRTATAYPLAGNTQWFKHAVLQIASGADLALTDFDTVLAECSLDGKRPDMIVMSNEEFLVAKKIARAEKYLEPNQALVDLGYPNNIDFGGITIVGEPALSSVAYGGFCTTAQKVIYLLNIKDSFKLFYDPGMNMMVGDRLEHFESNSYIRKINHGVQPVCYNPRLNGMIYWS